MRRRCREHRLARRQDRHAELSERRPVARRARRGCARTRRRRRTREQQRVRPAASRTNGTSPPIATDRQRTGVDEGDRRADRAQLDRGYRPHSWRRRPWAESRRRDRDADRRAPCGCTALGARIEPLAALRPRQRANAGRRSACRSYGRSTACSRRAWPMPRTRCVVRSCRWETSPRSRCSSSFRCRPSSVASPRATRSSRHGACFLERLGSRYGLPVAPRVRHVRRAGPLATLVIAYRSLE